MIRNLLVSLAAAAAFAIPGALAAQVATVDPNTVAQETHRPQEQPAASEWVPADAGPQEEQDTAPDASVASAEPAPTSVGPAPASDASVRASAASRTVPKKDVFSAAEGVFGKGAEGLADLIEDLLRKQGEPSAYITGREAGGAFVAGVRYGSGTLHHQVEGDRPIHWTGPSLGIDFGADAAKVFVLVYNLHDAQRIFRRYPAAEGNAYLVGGFTASYLRHGDVVLVPVRLGVGARLGINTGYMRFSQKRRWLPF
jgi:hypothetical protein